MPPTPPSKRKVHLKALTPGSPGVKKVDWAEIQRLLHLLWGKAHGTVNYNKEEWKLFQRLLEEADTADPNK